MGLSKEKVEELLKAVEDELESQMKAKNKSGVISVYHPDAVLIHKGVKAHYGHEEIGNAYEPFFNSNSEFDTKKTYAASSEDGEYLIRRGTFSSPGNPKEFKYEQIFKKEGGKYLIFHDEFEFE